jgi:peptide chain release factor subunit 1
VPAITEDTIRQLAGFRSRGAPVVSCYLDVDGRRHVRRQDVEAELDQLLRPVRSHSSRDATSADFAQIERWVRDRLDRSQTRGLAIFSCSARDLFEVIPLPVSVASRVVINSAPAIGQLEALVQELDRFGVLLVDKQRARMFVFEFGELVDHSERFDAKPRNYDSIGERDLVGYDKAEHHVEELVLQHLRHAADVAFEVFQSDGFDRLTVGAPDGVLPIIDALLHPYLQERRVGTIEVAPTASVADIRAAAMRMEAAIERDKEAGLVAKLRDAVGRGGRGVAGLEATLTALVERRIEVLFVSQGYRESGWRCDRCGYLCHRGPTCPVDGTHMIRADDIVEEAVDVAFGQSCKVEICSDNADLDVLGRIGALLRY